MSKLTVTYIKHSGFLIETANSYLLFGYWKGKLPELKNDKELSHKLIKERERIYLGDKYKTLDYINNLKF